MKYTQEEESLLSSIYVKCEIEQQRDTNILYNSIENYFENCRGVQFTEAEQNLINKIIKESNERYEKNGNRLYTEEEVLEDLGITMEEIEGENLGEQINSKVSYIIS